MILLGGRACGSGTGGLRLNAIAASTSKAELAWNDPEHPFQYGPNSARSYHRATK